VSFEETIAGIVRQVVREELDARLPRAAPTPPAAAALPLTVEEVAERARVTPATVREWIRGRRLAATKPGRHYLVEPAELARFLAQQHQQPAKLDSDEHFALIMGRVGRRTA